MELMTQVNTVEDSKIPEANEHEKIHAFDENLGAEVLLPQNAE
jgi:hypothetical protein